MIHWPTFGLTWHVAWFGLLALMAVPLAIGMR